MHGGGTHHSQSMANSKRQVHARCSPKPHPGIHSCFHQTTKRLSGKALVGSRKKSSATWVLRVFRFHLVVYTCSWLDSVVVTVVCGGLEIRVGVVLLSVVFVVVVVNVVGTVLYLDGLSRTGRCLVQIGNGRGQSLGLMLHHGSLINVGEGWGREQDPSPTGPSDGIQGMLHGRIQGRQGHPIGWIFEPCHIQNQNGIGRTIVGRHGRKMTAIAGLTQGRSSITGHQQRFNVLGGSCCCHWVIEMVVVVVVVIVVGFAVTRSGVGRCRRRQDLQYILTKVMERPLSRFVTTLLVVIFVLNTVLVVVIVIVQNVLFFLRSFQLDAQSLTGGQLRKLRQGQSRPSKAFRFQTGTIVQQDIFMSKIPPSPAPFAQGIDRQGIQNDLEGGNATVGGFRLIGKMIHQWDKGMGRLVLQGRKQSVTTLGGIQRHDSGRRRSSSICRSSG